MPEYAIHQIEKALIASYPQLAGQNATIEPKKIIEADGIRHEADRGSTRHLRFGQAHRGDFSGAPDAA